VTWNRNSRSAGPPGTGQDPERDDDDDGPPPPPSPPDAAAPRYSHRGTEGAIRVLEPGRILNQDGVPVEGPASRIEVVALDEFLYGFETVSLPSLERLSDVIGSFDQLAIQAVTDNVSNSAGGDTTLSVAIQHSADGIHWQTKRAIPEIRPFPLLSVTTYVPMGYDDGTSPSLAFVRLLVTLQDQKGGGVVGAHVNVRVTCNDVREITFARQLAREFKKEHKDLPKEYWKTIEQRVRECKNELTPHQLKEKPTVCGHKVHHVQGVNVVEDVPCDSDFERPPEISKEAEKDCAAMGISKFWIDEEVRGLKARVEDAQREFNTPKPTGPEWC